MINFDLTDEKRDEIVRLEEEYLANIGSIIESYQPLFAEYECEIKYSLHWEIGIAVYAERPPYKKNYQCWFSYIVTKNGETVCCDDVEGFSLCGSECFLYIRSRIQRLLKKPILYVTYVDDNSDIIDSLKKDFAAVKELFEKA